MTKKDIIMEFILDMILKVFAGSLPIAIGLLLCTYYEMIFAGALVVLTSISFMTLTVCIDIKHLHRDLLRAKPVKK